MGIEGQNTKKKLPLGLIICLAILIVCTGVAGVTLIQKNVASKKSIKMVEKMEASDAETLRKILAAEGTCTVTIAADITVTD